MNSVGPLFSPRLHITGLAQRLLGMALVRAHGQSLRQGGPHVTQPPQK
jgi:hypothetical protein